MRPIDGDALKERVDNLSGKLYSPILFEEMVKNSPTIEAEPVKHGHWVLDGIIKNYPKQDVNKYYLLTCSECGCMHRARKHESGSFINADFCPNCGAKMDLKDGEP